MGRGPMMTHTTRSQPHEQLLMGWITGGLTMTRTEGDGNEATTTASPCSQGGWEGAGGTTTTKRGGMTMTKREWMTTREGDDNERGTTTSGREWR
jgi:hypothetical protein